jgi:hypothetical protein
MSTSLHLEPGKPEQSSVNAAYDNDGSVCRCIFVTEKYTKTSFLIDSGADVCVYQRSKLQGPSRKDDYELFAVNISAQEYASESAVSIKTIFGMSNYYRLLAEFPDLTRPSVFGRVQSLESFL